jgi:hypothetical protein
MEDHEMVSLATLGRGAAIERFDDEFSKILQNILDPNTPPTAERSITLRVRLKPTENRDFCAVAIECSSKVAGAKPVLTQIFVGWDGRIFMATERNPNQMLLGIPEKEEKSDRSIFP